MSQSSFDHRQIDAFIKQTRHRFEIELASMVEIPTVSMDPEHRADIERGADLACRILQDAGANAEKVATAGYPVVVGEFSINPSAPTLTIYNHLDVQPADPADWHYPPFRFIRDDTVYRGRGTTDNKGPALAALAAARFALEREIPLNIRFIWEFEEEIGSPHFDGFLKARGPKLFTDSVLVSDTIWIAQNRPAVAYALRGLVSARLVLETGAKDVHSGLAGGLARNPVGELCDVVARCYDAKTGRVKIPGFYTYVQKPLKKELDSFKKSGFNLNRFKRAHELKVLRKTTPSQAMSHIWAQPTFEVHGLVGGYQGPGVKTIVPARAEAKVSMRLVPDQNPAKVLSQFKAFVKKVHPDVKVFPEHGMEPFLGEFSGPYADAARTALKFAFSREPAFVREGGSIGAVLSLQRQFKCPIVLMGLSLPEHGYHCPNEYFDWGQASGGIKAFIRYFEAISTLF